MKQIPKHIAIIMDGNGRWAKDKGLPRLMGHKKGVEVVREITEACSMLKVKHLTLYTFSEQNWNRPIDEVSGLMKLFVKSLKTELRNLNDNKYCHRCFDALRGCLSGFPLSRLLF